jgi:alpha-galactosidase
VQIHCPGERCSWLRYSLENARPEAIASFGLRFGQVENLRAYLANGYHSWDGTFYVDVEGLSVFGPGEQRPERGYAMTQLLPRFGLAVEHGGSVVLGFDRHERFQHEFHFDTRETPPALTILTHWDNARPDRNQPGILASERLLLLESDGVEEGLRAWAGLVAEEAQAAPRLSGPPITGWCSWYNLYSYINEEIILEYLRVTRAVAERERLPMRVFQIDDGFTPEMGDWLEVKPQFPRGMKPLIDDIRAAGFIPGLWIAPFLVGNRSRLFREHPDWVLHERATGQPLPIMKMYGEYRWHKRSEEYYCLDATHPEAFDYLRRVFRTWRREWGCEYFKTDFMLYGANYSPDEVSYHTPGLTRIEIWRRVAEMIREEIDDATWLGCGCPLWASIGLVDAIRIGGDGGVSWSEGISAQSLLRDQTTRSFASPFLWQIDPDCVLLRERFHHLSESELRSLVIFAGMSGGVMMTSDKLDELSPERLRLWRLILPGKRAFCEHPFLGRTSLSYAPVPDPHHPQQVLHAPQAEDPVLVQVRRGTVMDAVFVLNTGPHPLQRTYTLAELGLQSPLHVYDWTAGQTWVQPVDRLNLTLAPHDGALFFLNPVPITSAPERLP